MTTPVFILFCFNVGLMAIGVLIFWLKKPQVDVNMAELLKGVTVQLDPRTLNSILTELQSMSGELKVIHKLSDGAKDQLLDKISELLNTNAVLDPSNARAQRDARAAMVDRGVRADSKFSATSIHEHNERVVNDARLTQAAAPLLKDPRGDDR